MELKKVPNTTTDIFTCACVNKDYEVGSSVPDFSDRSAGTYPDSNSICIWVV